MCYIFVSWSVCKWKWIDENYISVIDYGIWDGMKSDRLPTLNKVLDNSSSLKALTGWHNVLYRDKRLIAVSPTSFLFRKWMWKQILDKYHNTYWLSNSLIMSIVILYFPTPSHKYLLDQFYFICHRCLLMKISLNSTNLLCWMCCITSVTIKAKK